MQQSTGDASQTIAILDHHGPLGMTAPSSSLGKTTLPCVNLMTELVHLPPQVVQLGQFSIDIQFLVVIAVRLGRAAGVKACHGSRALNIRDPNRSDLLEAYGETDILNWAAVHKVDVQTKQLLLWHIIPCDTGKVPSSIDQAVVLNDQGAASLIRKALTTDQNIAGATSLAGLVDVESKNQISTSRVVVALGKMKRNQGARNGVFVLC